MSRLVVLGQPFGGSISTEALLFLSEVRG